jgi:alpha-beta hydrolase superfamily lysophospholipase
LLDLDVFMARVREKSGDLPLFLMGNSMGGLIAATWAASRKLSIDGLILTGPLLAIADGLYPWARHMTGLMSVIGPALHVPRIPFQWLSRDSEAVAKFRNDPLVHPYFTVRVAAEARRAMKALAGHAAELTVPLMILHGSDDRICGPAGSRELYRNAGSTDKSLHLYDGLFHEVFDEPERDRVLADLLDWLGRHIPQGEPTTCSREAQT